MTAPYLPSAAEVKAELVMYTENIMNGLQSAGAKGKKAPKPKLKRTDKKVKIGSVERTVYTAR